ncbi:MAG TPA: glycosyltransferase family 4 protein [Candidatus Binataceae bacterium]|nr:glycosyltransferase family 4 protein [Candidatus Binataceae bacterium]
MRIGLITRRFDPAGGGTERDLVITARILTRAGHQVTIYAAEVRAPSSEWRVRRVGGSWPGRALGLLWFARTAGARARRDGAELVLSFARIFDADILRSGGGAHASYMRAARRWQTTAQGAAMRLSPYHRVQMMVEARGFRGPRLRRAIAVSRLVRDDLIATFGLAPAVAVTLYNGVELERFVPAIDAGERRAIRSAIGVADDAPAVMFVGNGFARKGLRFLLEAWPVLGDVPRLVVVGTDRAAETYKRLARPMGDRVIFLGRRGDVDRLLRGADVLAIPSLFEPFGNVALEAMACGAPALTSAQCGVAEVMSGALGAFVVKDPANRVELAERMGALIEAAPALSRAARFAAQQFTWDRHARELLALIEQAADTRA